MIELLDGLYSGKATPDNSGGGSTYKRKYGVTIDAILGNIDSDGKLVLPTTPQDVVLTGVKNIGSNGLRYKFYHASINSVSAPDLEELSTSTSCEAAFYASGVKSISFPKLKTVKYGSTMHWMFRECNLITAEFPALEEISGQTCMHGLFYGCPNLTTVSFPSLSNVGSRTDQFNDMLNNCTGVTVHFPAAMQSTMENWADVTAGFGGTNTTVLFDL